MLIISNLKLLLTGYEQKNLKLILKMNSSAGLRHFQQIPVFVLKSAHFNLKVALFVEKRQNKFAYEYKKNNFVYN